MALVLLVMAVYAVCLPLALWTRTRLAGAGRWRPQVTAVERVGHGTYRNVDLPRLVQGDPPWVVQVAALGCLVLGVMVLPGLALSFFGLLAMGIGLVGIPGLILATRLFLLAGPLMRGDLDAAGRARGAARHAVVLNILVLVACAALAVLYAFEPGNSLEAPALVAATALYALISLAHARVLTHAARALDKEYAARGQVPQGIRVAAPSEHLVAADDPYLRDCAPDEPVAADHTASHEPAD